MRDKPYGGSIRMKLTKGAIGNILNRYRAVLRKCHLLNTFGSLAVVSMLITGAGVAQAGEAKVDQALGGRVIYRRFYGDQSSDGWVALCWW